MKVPGKRGFTSLNVNFSRLRVHAIFVAEANFLRQKTKQMFLKRFASVKDV